jgi:hypothetical protein
VGRPRKRWTADVGTGDVGRPRKRWTADWCQKRRLSCTLKWWWWWCIKDPGIEGSIHCISAINLTGQLVTRMGQHDY